MEAKSAADFEGFYKNMRIFQVEKRTYLQKDFYLQ